MDQLDIGRRADERQRNQVDAEAQREGEVVNVFVRQGRCRDTHSGQRHALVVADRATFGDSANQVVAFDGIDHQPDDAVVDQNTIADDGVLG